MSSSYNSIFSGICCLRLYRSCIGFMAGMTGTTVSDEFETRDPLLVSVWLASNVIIIYIMEFLAAMLSGVGVVVVFAIGATVTGCGLAAGCVTTGFVLWENTCTFSKRLSSFWSYLCKRTLLYLMDCFYRHSTYDSSLVALYEMEFK